MLARRFALATGLLFAALFSQLPEFVQQYRQRLGGAVDELRRAIAAFDAEAAALSLTREAGIAHLRSSADPLASARGADVQGDLDRERRLEAQERAFATAGPIDQYYVFAERLDPGLVSGTWAIFQPALPVTPAGLSAAGVGLVAGYGGGRMVAAPFGRRRRRAVVAA